MASGAEFMCGLMKIQFGCYSRGTPHGWNLREWGNYCGSFGMVFLRAAAMAESELHRMPLARETATGLILA